MDEINKLVSPDTQALILQGLAFLTLAMPIFEKVAAKTKNKVDDRVVAFIEKALALVPRVSLGGKK